MGLVVSLPRGQLPVWQEFWQKHKAKEFQLITVAMDAQGPKLARRYVEQADASYISLVDQNGVLTELYNFKAIPNA